MKKPEPQLPEWITKAHNNNPLFFILGPCALEGEEHALAMAGQLKKLSQKLTFNFIFKSSFDKANRTSIAGKRGVGLQKGLAILEKIRNTYHLPVVTDIHESGQAKEVATVVDILQIPALLCRQTDLLLAAGRTQKPILVKKGQFITAEMMQSVIEKIATTQNKNVWLCERGYTFGYNNLIVDYRNFPIMKSFGKPIIFDVTHSVQRPGSLGAATGGNREFVPALATAAVTQGIAGIFIEVHDRPEHAFSDGPNSVRLNQLSSLLEYLINLDNYIKQTNLPMLD